MKIIEKSIRTLNYIDYFGVVKKNAILYFHSLYRNVTINISKLLSLFLEQDQSRTQHKSFFNTKAINCRYEIIIIHRKKDALNDTDDLSSIIITLRI